MPLSLKVSDLKVEFVYKSTSRGFNACNFLLYSDDILGVIGPSGCGKSTLLNCIAGFFSKNNKSRINRALQSIVPMRQQSLGAYTGSYTLLMENKIIDIKDHIRYLPQSLFLFEYGSIWENIRLGYQLQGTIHRSTLHREAKGLLESFHMYHDLNESVYFLSGGEKQRVGLARTLFSNKPSLFLLDEPFTGIDQNTKCSLIEQIKDKITSSHSILILVSHDVSDILPIANKFLIFTPEGGSQATNKYVPNFFDSKESLHNCEDASIRLQLYGCNLIKAHSSNKLNGAVIYFTITEDDIEIVEDATEFGNILPGNIVNNFNNENKIRVQININTLKTYFSIKSGIAADTIIVDNSYITLPICIHERRNLDNTNCVRLYVKKNIKNALNRIDILFVDLDQTLWNGIWGESSVEPVEESKVTLLKALTERGVSPCVLTNIVSQDSVLQAFNLLSIPLNIFVGIITSNEPKIIRIEKILNRISIPWNRIAIVDDDERIRRDFAVKGALTFSSFKDMEKYDWDKSNPVVSLESIYARLELRKVAIALSDLQPESSGISEIINYLHSINLKIYIKSDIDKTDQRVVELFERTNQMQFNRPFFKNSSPKEYKKIIDDYCSVGGKICTITIISHNLNLGTQGAILYRQVENRVFIDNASFSCTIIPFKIIEQCALANFANKMIESHYQIVFDVFITEKNKRVEWLLNDCGVKINSQNQYVLSTKINLPKSTLEFVESKQPSVTINEDGVPPITSFYDNNVESIFKTIKNGQVLDIGYGYGEILGMSRNQRLALFLNSNNSKLTRADIHPTYKDLLEVDVENMQCFENDNFNLILSLELLEHVANPMRAFSEILRVLKIGGFLFISTPGISYPYHAFDTDFSRFSSYFLTRLLNSFGNIDAINIQKYQGGEIRTMLLFNKQKEPSFQEIKSLFENAKAKSLLPGGLVHYE